MGARDPEPGTECGAWLLLREIGRGGMAVVFEAEHKDLGKRVAIKLLQPAAAGNPIFRARFQREGRAAVRVEHPHVAQVFDVGQIADTPFLVLELVDGPTLAEVIRREAPMSPGRVLELAMPVASALAKAHSLGVIHRDLKPANILVARDHHGKPSPKVLDFGLSKILDPNEEQLTRDQGTMGSLPYMAPEQLRSAADADPRSDQWALSVVLYECLVGQRPFRGDSPPAIMRAILEADPAPPSSVREDLPKALDAVLLRALHHDPDARFPSMQAFGASLLRFANASTYGLWAREFEEPANVDVTADDSTVTPIAAAPLATPRPEPRRTSRSWVPLALLLGLGALVTWGLARRTSEVQPASPSASPSASAPPPGASSAPIVVATSSAPPPATVVSASAAPSPAPSSTSSAPRPTFARPVASPAPSLAPSPVPSAPPPKPVPVAPTTSATGMLGSPILE